MIAAFALVLAVSFGQQSYLDKIVPSPTGRNGYEEYVQAAILLNRPENRQIESYVRAREQGRDFPDKPASIPEGLSLLELYRLQLKSLGPVFQLVQAGGQKPVTYPNPRISAVTLFPELVYFRLIGRLYQRSAYLAFSEGNTAMGTQAILDGLVFSKKVAVSGTIGFMISGSIQQLMLTAVQRHLRSFSMKDAERLQGWAEYALSLPTGLKSAAESARKEVYNTVIDLFTEPKEMLDYGLIAVDEENQAAFLTKAKAITPARRDELYRRFLKRLEAPWEAILTRLGQPESTWLDRLEVEAGDDGEMQTADVGGEEGKLVFGVVRMFMMLGLSEEDDGDLGLVRVAARYRIQERLLRLYAGVLAFKWNHGHLPGNLAEVFGREPVDAASGKPYFYDPQANGNFRIVCQTPQLGEVDLVYNANASGKDEGPAPP